MIVTEVVATGKTKYKVFVDYEFAFVLSAKEVRMYQIQQEEEISEEVFREIMDEIILPKAKLKAMDLLVSMDRTEYELLTKLKAYGFSEEASEEALKYVKKFNYINDYRYACNYLSVKRTTKSLRMIRQELIRKGVSKELIDQAIEEEYHEDVEEEAIRREVKKKCKSVEDLTYEKKMKIVASLYRKGYSPSIVRKVIGNLSIDDIYS